MNNVNLLKHTDDVNALLARYGVKFGIYKNNEFKEQLFPFDAIPRVIEHDEFEYLEKGLKQRVSALNLFLKDIYSEKKIVKDGVVPEDFVIDDILAFWGMIDDKLDDDHIRNIIKSGKRIERFDLYARLGLGREVLIREANRMIPRIEKSGMDVKKEKLLEIRRAVEEQEVDYYGVIKMVEALIA